MTWSDWLIFGLATSADVLAAGHALLHQRDPRTAWGWIAACMLLPGVGPVFYFLFGINRVAARARKLSRRSPFDLQGPDGRIRQDCGDGRSCPPHPDIPEDFAALALAVSGRPLVFGNHMEFLENGEQAFPRMLDAIEKAQRTVYLATYIFEANDTGQAFADALARARQRGVDVRVVLDGVGELTQLPLAGTLLKRRGVPVLRFLPPTLAPPAIHVNLRCHHKILVVDGQTAFTGGMNIGDRYLAGRKKVRHRVTDTHFLLRGPIAAQLEEVFLWDWGFAAGREDEAPDPAWPRTPEAAGMTICRSVVDGPADDLDRLVEILCAAIASAKSHVRIMTPYFLPPQDMLTELRIAAKRGVAVEVMLPSDNDVPLVHYAMRHMLPQVLEHGIRVFIQPPPFAHTKHFIVDSRYVLVGSPNLDQRSLRLNFELAVEVHDSEAAQILIAHFEKIRHVSRELTLGELAERTLPARIRDAACWLFSPYM